MTLTWACVLCSIFALSVVGAHAAGPKVSFDSGLSTDTVRLGPRIVVHPATVLSNLRLTYGSGLYLREDSRFGASGSEAELGVGFAGACFDGFTCDADSVVQAFQSDGRSKLAVFSADVRRAFGFAGGHVSFDARLAETFDRLVDRNRRLRLDAAYSNSMYGVPVRLRIGMHENRAAKHAYMPITLSADLAHIVQPDDTRLSMSFDGSAITPYASRLPEKEIYTVGIRLRYSW